MNGTRTRQLFIIYSTLKFCGYWKFCVNDDNARITRATVRHAYITYTWVWFRIYINDGTRGTNTDSHKHICNWMNMISLWSTLREFLREIEVESSMIICQNWYSRQTAVSENVSFADKSWFDRFDRMAVVTESKYVNKFDNRWMWNKTDKLFLERTKLECFDGIGESEFHSYSSIHQYSFSCEFGQPVARNVNRF